MSRSESTRTPRPPATAGPPRRAPRRLAALLWLIAAAPAAGAGPDASPRYLRGLLELPRIGLRADGAANGAANGAVDGAAAAGSAFDAPSGPRSATLLSAPGTGIGTVVGEPGPAELASAPSGPGRTGALVFDVAGGAEAPWYLLARQSGGRIADYGWYRAAPDERLRPYESLLADGLAFMRHGWDGNLYASPADALPHRVVPPSGGGAIRVADAWMDADDPGASWLLIVVLVQDSVCADDWPVVVASGWVRAYRDDADPAAWFHADGC